MDSEYFGKGFTVFGAKLSRIFSAYLSGLLQKQKVKIPKPELYVIFTGNKGWKPDKISLSKEFFEDVDIDIEVKAKVIYESDTDDIINQYVTAVFYILLNCLKHA